MLDSISAGDDIEELTVPAGNTTVSARHIYVVSAGAGTKILKVKTAKGNDRSIAVTDGWSRAIKVTTIYGTSNGTGAGIIVQYLT